MQFCKSILLKLCYKIQHVSLELQILGLVISKWLFVNGWYEMIMSIKTYLIFGHSLDIQITSNPVAINHLDKQSTKILSNNYFKFSFYDFFKRNIVFFLFLGFCGIGNGLRFRSFQ